MKNLIKTIFFVFLLQFCNAQKKQYPLTILIDDDSLVCFTIEQSKQLAIWNEEKKECINLYKNSNQKIVQIENILITQKGIIDNLENEIIQHNKNLEDKNKIISVFEPKNPGLRATFHWSDSAKTIRAPALNFIRLIWTKTIRASALDLLCLI